MKPPVDPWGNVSDTVVELGDASFTITHPTRSDDLISEQDYVMDERLPYWADMWPSSRVLAAELLKERPPAGTTMLELGCGLGLVSTAAATAGFEVLATDYYEPALSFTTHNVQRNTSRTPRTMMLNWRHMPEDLGKFDFIVASDILYEKEYGVMVANIFADHLRDGGTAIMADPGRLSVDQFLERIAERGLRVLERVGHPIEDDGRKQTVNIYRMGW